MRVTTTQRTVYYGSVINDDGDSVLLRLGSVDGDGKACGGALAIGMSIVDARKMVKDFGTLLHEVDSAGK